MSEGREVRRLFIWKTNFRLIRYPLLEEEFQKYTLLFPPSPSSPTSSKARPQHNQIPVDGNGGGGGPGSHRDAMWCNITSSGHLLDFLWQYGTQILLWFPQSQGPLLCGVDRISSGPGAESVHACLPSGTGIPQDPGLTDLVCFLSLPLNYNPIFYTEPNRGDQRKQKRIELM